MVITRNQSTWVRQVKLSSARIRKLLKKGWVWKRARISHQDKQNQETKAIKQADLDFLELAAAVGEICLKYIDETGFSCWSPMQYGWIRQGQNKRPCAVSGLV
jgi:hypothetical protein